MIIARRFSSSGANYKRSLIWPLFLIFQVVESTIYIGNGNGNNETTYASLPGLFGKILRDNNLYEARLQFLPENPYLCDSIADINQSSSFVVPTITTVDENENNNNNNSTALPKTYAGHTDPIVLLAGRGQCPFQRKASIAESIDPSVQFLIVHNYKIDNSGDYYYTSESEDSGEDTIIPMYSEFGDTRLALLSITHRAGMALKRYIVEQPIEIKQRGGPWIEFDNLPPDNLLLSVEELRNMLLSAIGLFFMLISFSGCILIVAGTYGHVQMDGSRIVFTTTTTNGGAGGGGIGGIPMPHRRNMLLTEEQVRTLAETIPKNETTITTGRENNNNNSGEQQDHHCAVCIEELISYDNDDSSQQNQIMTLPCQHQFHTDCLLPWLTERQSKCPLCKFDVLEYVQIQEELIRLEQQQNRANGNDNNNEIHGKAPSWYDRILRYRWTTVATTTNHGGSADREEGVEDEEEETTPTSSRRRNSRQQHREGGSSVVELELTEQQRQPSQIT